MYLPPIPEPRSQLLTVIRLTLQALAKASLLPHSSITLLITLFISFSLNNDKAIINYSLQLIKFYFIAFIKVNFKIVKNERS